MFYRSNGTYYMQQMNGEIELSTAWDVSKNEFLPFELLLKHMLKVILRMSPVSSSCSELDSYALGLLGIFLLPFYHPPFLEFFFGLSGVLQFKQFQVL